MAIGIELKQPLDVELVIQPTWSILTAVRRFVEDAVGFHFPNPDLLSRLSMSAHELLENAIKYSIGDRAWLRLYADNQAQCAGVVLKNATSRNHIDHLEAQFAEIRNVTDPYAFYRDLMHRYARQPESHLGLGRIMAEGEMKLTLKAEGDFVSIQAETGVPRLP